MVSCNTVAWYRLHGKRVPSKSRQDGVAGQSQLYVEIMYEHWELPNRLIEELHVGRRIFLMACVLGTVLSFFYHLGLSQTCDKIVVKGAMVHHRLTPQQHAYFGPWKVAIAGD